MRFRRFVAFFLLFVLMANLISVRAFASSLDDDWNWSDSVNDYVLVPFSDLVSDAIVSVDDVFDTLGDVLAQNFKDTLDFWSGLFSVDSSQSYDDYVSSLDTPVVSGSAVAYYYPTDWVFTKLYADSWEDVSLVSGQGSLSFVGLNLNRVTSTSIPPRIVAWFTSGDLTLPRGTYRIYADYGNYSSWSAGSVPSSVFSDANKFRITWDRSDYSNGLFVSKGEYFEFTVDSEFDVGSVSVGIHPQSVLANTIYSQNIGVHIECIYQYSEPGSGAGRPGSETRVGSLMQTINQYNSYDYSTKYYIGTVDNSNNVTNVYAPNIFNEQTKVFTEPVTGQQYQCTGWKYGYTSAARGYRLDLAEDTYNYNGTDIRTVCLFYLDDALYIVGLDQVYDDYFSDISTVEDFFLNASFVQKYSYVVAETSGDDSELCNHVYTSETVTAPTCLDQGVRRYTCELCGHIRDEYIPAAGHAWEVTESFETEVDADGDVIVLGYKVYTCSVCGETYKEYDDIGQPDEPSGGGSDEDEGWLSWLGGLFRTLISSIVNGLASGLEYLVDKVIVTVTDLIIQTIQWVMDLLNIDHLTGFFSWFSDGNEVFQEEFGQDTEEAEVDVWAYS